MPLRIVLLTPTPPFFPQVLEGVFKLEAPPVILGYQQVSDRPPCVHLCMALRPQVVPPSLVEDERISGEAEDITQHAAR